MKKSLPTISVVTATYNSAKTLDKCLGLVRSQDYPQNKIEIILGDGGSTDNTPEIAKKYKAKVVNIPPEKQNAEYNRGVAFNKAKGKLVLILDHDNFMTSKDWLKRMVEPLLKHPKMVATETCYYHYDRRYSLLDRYFALFGVLDPIPYYLKKADRMPQNAETWVNQGKAQDMGDYYLVEFEKDPGKFPTIGTNGCLMRRKLVVENANVRPKYHYPIDVMVDVLKKGLNQFGFVKIPIAHLTGYRGVIPYIKRRKMFMEEYHLRDLSKRRYSVFMQGDEWQLAKYIFFSLTLVKPTWDALRGFLQIPDLAWLLHPLMCLGITLVYGYSVVKSKIKGLFG